MLDKRSKLASKQYSVLSKYIDYFKETDEDLKITTDLLGMTASNRFITHNTSPRGSMMHGHIGSSVVLVNPSKKIIQSDVDKEFADTAMLKRFENDVIVLSVIQRYRNGTVSDSIKPVEYVIVYRDTVTDEVNALSIPVFNRYHIYFGFMYNIDREYIESLITDDLIPAGKVLAWPNSYDPKTGMYGPGRTLNVALMSEDLTSEDGVIISKSTEIALKHTIIENRRGSGGSETTFLNVHGDEDNYKPIVGIGEKIGDRSIAFAIRDINSKTSPALMSKKNMCKINPIFDKATYASNPNGEVVDVKVIFNKKRKKKLLKGTSELLDRYKDAYILYCRDLINTYANISKSYKFSTGVDLIVGYEYNTMLVQAYNIVFSTTDDSKIKKMYRKETLDLYTVNMDIRQDLLCGVKNKITSMNGDESI
jgi:hypothetical protein